MNIVNYIRFPRRCFAMVCLMALSMGVVAADGPVQVDSLELDSSSITGNQELPKVVYIVPWKESTIGDLRGKPINSLLDEVLAPVDREEFRREIRYFEQLYVTGSEPVVVSVDESVDEQEEVSAEQSDETLAVEEPTTMQ